METTASSSPLTGPARLAAITALALAGSMSNCTRYLSAWSVGGATARTSRPPVSEFSIAQPVETTGARSL